MEEVHEPKYMLKLWKCEKNNNITLRIAALNIEELPERSEPACRR